MESYAASNYHQYTLARVSSRGCFQFRVRIATKISKRGEHMRILHHNHRVCQRWMNFDIICCLLVSLASILFRLWHSRTDTMIWVCDFYKSNIIWLVFYLIQCQVFLCVLERLFASAINEVWPCQDEARQCARHYSEGHPFRAVSLTTKVRQNQR